MRVPSSAIQHQTPPPALRPIHPFPARMAPAIVWEELPALRAVGSRPLRVLDPMAGSGTTLATARLLGHCGTGFDTDPLAVLIATAWAADVDAHALRTAAAAMVEEARRRTRGMRVGAAYPEGADDETRSFIRYWFDETARRHLTALSATITESATPALAPLLWCTFSRLIIVKSAGASRAMDAAHSRPHREYERAPVKPLAAFERAARAVAKHSPFADGVRRPQAVVRQADARALPVRPGTADLVITSPPYLNAIDYLRGHKLSLVWMGHSVGELRQIRADNVGTEVSAPRAAHAVVDARIDGALGCMGQVERLRKRDLGMVRRYLTDMDVVMRQIARALVVGGRAVLVIGDSTLGGVFLRNSAALEHLGREAGLTPLGSNRRPLPPSRRYLPPPCAKGAGDRLTSRMREEVILRFRHPS
jgi:SAM-dependent methyltransferase